MPTPAPTPTSAATVRARPRLRRAAAPHRRRRSSTRSRQVDGVDEVGARVNGYAQLVDKTASRRRPEQARRVRPELGRPSTSSTRTSSPRAMRRRRRRDRHRQALGRHGRLRAGRSRDRAHQERAARSSRSPASPSSATPTRPAARRRCCSPTPPRRQLLAEPGKVDGIAVTADAGVVAGRARRPRSQAVVGGDVEVITGAALTTEDQDADRTTTSPVFSTFMLVFAVIAMFVGAFIINNTFSITVAQRTREMAMLRAIGAERASGDALGAHRGRRGRRPRVGRRSRRRHRCGRRLLKALLGSFGFDMPDGPTVIAAEHDRRLAGRRCRRDRRCRRGCRPAGPRRSPPIAALRDVARRPLRRLQAPRRRRYRRSSARRRRGAARRSRRRRDRRSSVSVRSWCSSACRCSARCSPVRWPACSVRRCRAAGHGRRARPRRTRCATRSAPPAPRRR